MTTNDTNPQPKLPDYKPKGMSKGDKIMTWILVFIVVFAGLGILTQKLGASGNKATPVATATAKPTPKATVKINPNALTIHLSSTDKWYIDAYASLHHVTEQQAATALIRAGIKAQK